MSKSSACAPPLSVTELLQLTQLGIPLEHVTWPRVSMTSDNWVCIRHSQRGRTNKRKNSVVTVLNPHRGDFPQSWQTIAGSVKMNPWKPLIALKAGPLFQIYDLVTHELLVKRRICCSIVFWTWVNSSIIVLVTDASVYHWHILKDDSPVRIFHRHPRLAKAEIVNYCVDETSHWCALSGLTVEDDRICGVTQIYSVDHHLSQPFEAHAVNFGQYRFQGNIHPSTVMVAAVRGEGNVGKMHIIELGPYMDGNQAAVSLSESLVFVDHWEKYDFPVSVQITTKMGLVYILTKHGDLHIGDLETGAVLCSTNMSADIVFTSALNTETQGVIFIARNGQVLSVDLKKDHLIQYVKEVVKRPAVAERLKSIINAK